MKKGIIDFILKRDYNGLKRKLEKSDEDINQLSISGNSFLIEAIAEGFEEAAILLIEKRINVSVLNNDQDSALSVAAEHNLYNVAKLIIEKDKTLVNIPDSYGNAPLWVAIICALKRVDIDYSMIDLLLKNGANLLMKNHKGQTCIDLIKRRERFEMIKYLKTTYPDDTDIYGY